MLIVNLYCRYLVAYYNTDSQTRGPILSMMNVLENSRTSLSKEQFKSMFNEYSITCDVYNCDNFYDIILTDDNIQTYIKSQTSIIDIILSKEAMIYHANIMNELAEQIPYEHLKTRYSNFKTTIENP